MDYSKLADEFIEEGAWQGAPVIAVSMFAKWLEEREAAQQKMHPTNGGLCAECGSPSWAHGAIGHAFKSHAISG